MLKTKIIRQLSWSRGIGLLLLVWFIFIVIAFGSLKDDNNDGQTSYRLNRALNEFRLLKQQRSEVGQLLEVYVSGNPSLNQGEKEALFKSYQKRISRVGVEVDPADLDHGQPSDTYLGGGGAEPSAEYEKTRRRLWRGVQEMWYLVSAQVRQAQHLQGLGDQQRLNATLHRILRQGGEHKRALARDLVRLEEVDGWSGWRQKEAASLSDLVQRRFHFLQNPPDCSTAKKLVCNLNKYCGYGCQVHHAVYCLLVAYGTQRTLLLQSKRWRYHRAGFDDVFRPVSDSCPSSAADTANAVNWPGVATSRVLVLPIVDSVSPRPVWLPPAVPRDLVPRLARLHGDPLVWWVGQALKYLLRPQPDTQAMLQRAATQLNFRSPIVGVHIRRTDKVGTEAAYHALDEYMQAVDEWYAEQTTDDRRVYLASDDPAVFAEIRAKYPAYEVLGDESVARSAAVATRYSDASLNGILTDIHMLSMCDHLVCTFSSQVCRVAYEIMQTLHPDAADRFRSLDDIYYFGGQSVHRRVATAEHKAGGVEEMELAVGDTVGVAGNHWDGFSKGRNLRTNRIGLYPSFKVEDVIEAVEFPTYPQVPIEPPI